MSVALIKNDDDDDRDSMMLYKFVLDISFIVLLFYYFCKYCNFVFCLVCSTIQPLATSMF